MKVLLVGTGDLSRRVKQLFLDRAHCDVLTCGDGREALALAAAEHPNLIVLGDVTDPEAFECRRRLQAAESTRGLPVLLLVTDEQRPRAPADAELADRDDPQQILDRVLELLERPRRYGVRRPVKLRVDVYGPAGHGVGHTRDLSISGMYLRSDLDLAPGDAVQLIFGLPVPGRPTVRAVGEVVRRQAQDNTGTPAAGGLGIRFRKVGRRDRSAIAGLVDESS